MKLSKIIETLTWLENKCKDKSGRLRLNIKEVRLKCDNDLTITFGDKFKKANEIHKET